MKMRRVCAGCLTHCGRRGRAKASAAAAAEPAREAEADGAVCFESGGEPGIELPLKSRFEALGWRWTAAALGLCPEGLVLRLAREVAPEDFAAFMARCGLSFEDAGRKYSAAERMRIEAENPLGFDFDAALLLNGERLESSGSSGSSSDAVIAAGG